MRRLTRRTAATLAVCLGIVVPAGSAFAGATPTTTSDGPSSAVVLDTSAVSVNTTNNTSVFHLAFTIVRSTGASVSVSNVALAVSTCLNCRSTAIAIQVDLVWPVPVVLSATNLAVAVNSGCVTCDTLAAAFQYVIASDQMMTLTGRGRDEVAHIERELAALQSSSRPTSAVAERVDGLAAELGSVLNTDLVAVHRGADAGDHHADARPAKTADVAPAQPAGVAPAQPAGVAPAQPGGVTAAEPGDAGDHHADAPPATADRKHHDG
jgi:hypothetical protein